MAAAIIKTQAGPGDEVSHRARHEHLASIRERGDARSDMHRDAANVIAGKHDLPRMNTRADLETDGPHCRRDLRGTSDGPCRSLKRREKAVAGCVHLVAVVTGDERADPTVMLLQELGPAPIAELHRSHGRAR